MLTHVPAKPLVTLFPIRFDVQASAWPGCNFEFFSRSLDGAVMACAGRTLAWWDRDVDTNGRPIRCDVRVAGRELWEQACQQTIAVVADPGPAAELMEKAVAQVSRYLDRIGAPTAPRKHGLVMVAFRRALARYRAKLSRLELVGGCYELSTYASSESWAVGAEARLELEKLIRKLSARNAEVLMLRAAGFEWKEIASSFGESVANIRNRFWREIDRLARSSPVLSGNFTDSRSQH